MIYYQQLAVGLVGCGNMACLVFFHDTLFVLFILGTRGIVNWKSWVACSTCINMVHGCRCCVASAVAEYRIFSMYLW